MFKPSRDPIEPGELLVATGRWSFRRLNRSYASGRELPDMELGDVAMVMSHPFYDGSDAHHRIWVLCKGMLYLEDLRCLMIAGYNIKRLRDIDDIITFRDIYPGF